MNKQSCYPDLFAEWVKKYLDKDNDPMCVINNLIKLVELAKKVYPTIDFSNISGDGLVQANALCFIVSRICTMTKDRIEWINKEHGNVEKSLKALQSIGANWSMCKAPVHNCETCKNGEAPMEEVEDVWKMKDKEKKEIIYACSKCGIELGRKPMTKLRIVKE